MSKEQWNEILRNKKSKSDAFLSSHDGAITLRLDDDTLFFVDIDVVCRASHYFQSLFLGNWAESTKAKSGEEIRISEIPSDIMTILLHYIYVDQVNWAQARRLASDAFFEKYWSLVYWAQLFDLSEFEEELSDCVTGRHLTCTNIVTTWHQARVMACLGLQRQCVRCLVRNFTAFSANSSNSTETTTDPISISLEKSLESYVSNGDVISALAADSFFSCPRELLLAALNTGEIDADYDEQVALVLEWGRRNIVREGVIERLANAREHYNNDSLAIDEVEIDFDLTAEEMQAIRRVSPEALQRYCADLLPPATLFNRQHKDFLFALI